MTEILKGLTEREAATDPWATDPRLRGRTYAIPFDDVWNAATTLAGGRLQGWSLASADDQAGILAADTKTGLLRVLGAVVVEVRLDENGQTRVDGRATSATRRGDWGRARRVLGAFFAELDRTLGANAGQILDPTLRPPWLAPQ